MFWPIIPIMTVTGMQVVIQPLPSSIWKLPFHAIKVMEIGPACQLFIYDGGTFQHGNAFIQSSDDGSHLEIFSIHPETATYGFGISGCSTFDRACVLDFKAFLVCLLPPALNQCGRSIWNLRDKRNNIIVHLPWIINLLHTSNFLM